MTKPAFEATRVLRFGDCDPSGIAYFPTYLDLLVGVVEEFFASLGAPWPQMIATRRIGLPTVTLSLEFSKPGFHGDPLEFRVLVRALGRSSLDLEHTVTCRQASLWTATQRIVATDLGTHRATAWPDDLRAVLMSRIEAAS